MILFEVIQNKTSSTKIIELLYKRGVSLYTKDNKGRTPFDYGDYVLQIRMHMSVSYLFIFYYCFTAVNNAHVHVIGMLHSLGVDLNQKSSSGTTAFHQGT